MSRRTKIIFIVAVLLILIAVVVGVIFGFRKIPTVPSGGQGTGSLPVSSTGPNKQVPAEMSPENVNDNVPGGTDISSMFPDLKRLTQLTKGKVVDYFIVSSTVLSDTSAPSSSLLSSAVFYINASGDIIRVLDFGKEENISHLGGTPLGAVQSSSGLYVVIEFTSHDFALFNSQKGSFEWLPQGVSSVVFSPDGNKLAYLQIDSSGKQSLYIRDLTSLKKTATKVFSLFVDDVSLAWPVGNNIYLVPPQSANMVGEIWYFDTVQKTLNKLTSGSGLGMVFSSRAPFALLFKNTNNNSISIYLDNIKTSTSTPLEFTTVASKCVFSFDTNDALCAVPQVKSRSTVSTLPDDYNDMYVFTNDYLYQLPSDIGYQPQTLLGTTQIPFDATHLRSRAQQLFFINRLDDSLYVFDMRKM